MMKEKTIELGLGVKIEILDTDFALSHKLVNDDSKMDQYLGWRLK